LIPLPQNLVTPQEYSAAHLLVTVVGTFSNGYLIRLYAVRPVKSSAGNHAKKRE
jgi:hypothetical protein